MDYTFTFKGSCTLSSIVPVTVGSQVTCVGMKSNALTLTYNDTDAHQINCYDVSKDGSVATYTLSDSVTTPLGEAHCNYAMLTDDHTIMDAEFTQEGGSAPNFTYQYVFGFNVDGKWTQCGGGNGTYQTSLSAGSGFIYAGVVSASIQTIDVDGGATLGYAGTCNVNGETTNAVSFNPSLAVNLGRALNSEVYLGGGAFVGDNFTLQEVAQIGCTNTTNALACKQIADNLAAYECVDLTTFSIFTMLLDFSDMAEYRLDGGYFVPFDRTWGVMYDNNGTAYKADLNFPSQTIPRAVYPYHLLVPLPLGCIPLCEDNP